MICECGNKMEYVEHLCTSVNTVYKCKCGKISNKSILFDKPVFADF